MGKKSYSEDISYQLKKSVAFYWKVIISLYLVSFLRQLDTELHSDPDESSPYPLILLFNSYFNIILLPVPDVIQFISYTEGLKPTLLLFLHVLKHHLRFGLNTPAIVFSSRSSDQSSLLCAPFPLVHTLPSEHMLITLDSSLTFWRRTFFFKF